MTFSDGVLILYNTPRAQAAGGVAAWSEADTGVLAEVDAVAQALTSLGLPWRKAGIESLRGLPQVVNRGGEPTVFNLVEGLAGDPFDVCLVPDACRALGRSCTGNGTVCQVFSLDKWQAKAQLLAHGVPCPPARIVPPGRPTTAGDIPAPGRLICKPLRADASEGIDDAAVIEPDNLEALRAAVARVHREFHQPALVEAFVEGKELNVSVLQHGGDMRILPLAEIDFSAFPEGKTRMINYAAKWLPESFEFHHTPRKIPAELDGETATAVRDCALKAWHALGCRDYARVDIRLDAQNHPWVLEVNPNPDISPDAGFAAALTAGGISFTEFVNIVLRNAAERDGSASNPPRGLRLRPRVKPRISWSESRDRDAILTMMNGTAVFYDYEIDIAREVLDEALEHGPSGHYQSFTAHVGDTVAGWLALGPTPCADRTFDIYWIGVAKERQGEGIGVALMDQAEEVIRRRDGRVAVLETSGRPCYDSTRAFYIRCGYYLAATVPEFYGPNDDKLIYVKRFEASAEGRHMLER